MQKQVFINGRFLCQTITGEQRYAFEIVKQWDNMIHEKMILLCPKLDREKPSFKNIEIREIGPFSGQLWVHSTLPKYVKKHNGVLITLCGLSPIFHPDFWTVHDITFIKEPRAFDWKFRLLYRSVYRLNIKKAKQVFTVSNFSRNELANYYGLPSDKIIIEYPAPISSLGNHGVCENTYFNNHNPLYISVGSLKPNKNISYIFKLAKMNKDVNFLLVGGKYKSFNDVSLKDSPNVKWTGYISDEELISLYKICDGIIIPSTYEGFGLTPLEAIVNGCKKVFVSDIPVFREVYDRGVNYFDPYSDGFTFEESKYVEITDLDRKYYESKYDFKKTAQDYLRVVYDRICEEHNHE